MNVVHVWLDLAWLQCAAYQGLASILFGILVSISLEMGPQLAFPGLWGKGWAALQNELGAVPPSLFSNGLQKMSHSLEVWQHRTPGA